MEQDSESESDLQPGPLKRLKQKGGASGGVSRKFSGAAQYKTKFQHTWQEKWPFATPVLGDPHSFRCAVCNKLVSCSHQGEKDVSRHHNSSQHQMNVTALGNTRKLSFRPSAALESQKEKVNSLYS